MKTQDEIKAEAENLIREYVRENFRAVDSEDRYAALLDELYQDKLDKIPALAGVTVSQLIKENAPTDYRCGKVDWLDGEDIREFDGSEWDGSDLDEAREAVADDLESQISDKEGEIEEIQAETVTDENAEPNNERIAELRDDLDELNATLAAVNAYAF